ncbi:SPP1 family phage portal protein [Clostridium pascui]|uniref:phage portal protein n=1 Tax=Clostridium pascui TaxID=46609 RepID=UPI0019561CFC|nr:phage portal protein [Clostridium pascui]MBM7869227.1 SPP1 family phage portal protein [Clostridium pascui]
MDLQEYIKEYYCKIECWFVSECCQQQHVNRINKVVEIKEYLDGHRKNDNLKLFIDGRWVEPTKIKLNFASVLLDHNVSFLLKNPITLICGDDEETLKEYQKVYKRAKLKRIDTQIYENMKAYGQVFEYLWFDDEDNIKSKILLPECSYPVYTDTGNYVAFIYHFITQNYVEYYTVYYPDRVEEYTTRGGKAKLISTYKNYGGLPIPYRIPKKTNMLEGKSDVECWKMIIDNMEKLSSKYQDALYKFITGIPVMTGTKLSITKDGKGAINPDIVGYALQLEDGSTFDFKQNKTDYQSMKLLHDTLFNYLLIASCVPAVSLNAQDVSNLSETSIRMMYQLAILKAGIDSQNMKDGFYVRWERIRKMLAQKNIYVEGDMDCEFQMEIPQNAKEVIENLKTLREINGISFESMLAKNPYTADINGEMEKILKEINEDNINLDDVETDTTNNDTEGEGNETETK